MATNNSSVEVLAAPRDEKSSVQALFHKPWVRHALRAYAPPVVFFVIILAVWSLAIVILNLPTYILPSPLRIWDEIRKNTDVFVRAGMWTLLEAVAGYLLGGGIGLLLGTTLALSKFLERGLLPYIVGATTIPIVAFAPLVVIYVGADVKSKIAIAAIVSFFPLCLYTLKGLQSTELVQRDLFYSLAASRWDVFFRLQWPTSLPYVLTAMKQTSTVAVIAAIIAEYIQADRGFGYLILQSSYTMNIPRMWSAVLFSSLMAMVFYAIVVFIERRLVAWHSSLIEQRQ